MTAKLIKPQTSWDNILWIDETKVEMFLSLCIVLCLAKIKNNVSPWIPHISVRHGGAGVMIWAGFATIGPGILAVMETETDGLNFVPEYSWDVRPTVQQLKLGQNWIKQQNNDPKHSSNLTSEWITKKKKNQGDGMAKSKSRPQYHQYIEILWPCQALKRAVQELLPSKINELKRRCKEDWAKIFQTDVTDW